MDFVGLQSRPFGERVVVITHNFLVNKSVIEPYIRIEKSLSIEFVKL